jgi:hypothetical protein
VGLNYWALINFLTVSVVSSPLSGFIHRRRKTPTIQRIVRPVSEEVSVANDRMN